MMGKKRRVFSQLPRDVSLEDLVRKDHFYRRLEATLDLSFVRELVRSLYTKGGRPSVDPVVFYKLQLVMFFEDLRSERQLMRVVADRLSVRWYLGYDLQEPLPDHPSLTRIRERYGLGVFRRFFERLPAAHFRLAGVDDRPRRHSDDLGKIRQQTRLPGPPGRRRGRSQDRPQCSGHALGGYREPSHARPALEHHLPLAHPPRQVTGDAKYGTRENIAGLELRWQPCTRRPLPAIRSVELGSIVRVALGGQRRHISTSWLVFETPEIEGVPSSVASLLGWTYNVCKLSNLLVLRPARQEGDGDGRSDEPGRPGRQGLHRRPEAGPARQVEETLEEGLA
jgi:transposase